MNNVPINIRIMDIAQNLARVGNWAADSHKDKQALIKRFLDQTEIYLHDSLRSHASKDTEQILSKFKIEFEKLKKEKITKNNKEAWAERMLTWANILQSRASV